MQGNFYTEICVEISLSDLDNMFAGQGREIKVSDMCYVKSSRVIVQWMEGLTSPYTLE